MRNNYCVYHLHSDLSSGITNIDSVTKYKQYIERAKECGMTAMAFSEHGSVFEWWHKKQDIEAVGMKYIHAIEAYITEGLNEKVRDNYHCVLIARNYEGFREINKLSSISFNRDDGHFYYVPRITIDELLSTSNNVLITSACLGGILHNGTDEIRRKLLEFFIKNKDRCFLEIQHHQEEEQKKYNLELVQISEKTGIPLIAGTDTHALNAEHLDARAMLQKSKNVHFENEDAWDLTFKTYDELVAAYEEQGVLSPEIYQQAIENTNVMADMIEEFSIDKEKKYPKLYEDSKAVFIQKIAEGFEWRGINNLPNRQEYLNRAGEEIKTFEHNGAIDFMLLEEDYKRELRKKGVYPGYSRGSVSGSLVAYLLGITEVDSIKHNLNFQRFMNTERISLADIDSDWYDQDRETVKQYLYNKEGLYCCDIITFNTIQTKGAIRDIGRALEMSLDLVGEICDSIERGEEHYRKEYPELFRYVDLVSGVIVSVGNHPAGVVVSPFPIEEWFGTFTTKTNKYPISQINMKEIDSLNFVKLDILGLDNVGLINKTCEMLGIERLTPNNTPLEKEVFESIRDDTTCIFQWESDLASAYIKRLFSDETIEKIKERNPDFSYMDLLSVGNGALRPAGSSYREELARGEFRDNGHGALNKMLASTQGFLVFQEQIIQFLNEFCGYTMGEADVVRRCVSEDTQILLANGNQCLIKDIQPEQEVVTYNEYGDATIKKVTNKFDNGQKEVFEISAKHNLKIQATKDHKILTQRGWVQVADLSKNDFIMTPRKIKPVNDGLKSNKRLSSETMFMLGILIGDGTLSHNPIFTNSDIDLVHKYKDCVNQLLRNPVDCKFKTFKTKGKNVDFIYSVGIRSDNYKKSLKKLLDKCELRKLSAQKSIPEVIMNYPIGKKIFNLLAGLFNTDGYFINSSKAIAYSSMSKILCQQIQSLLLKMGIAAIIYRKHIAEYDKYCYEVYIKQLDSLRLFKSNILPYMVGEKRELFSIGLSNMSSLAYNYFLPSTYVKEIRQRMEEKDISLRNIGLKNGEKNLKVVNDSSVTDIKAQRIISHIYCPESYFILNADYYPCQIKSIKKIGVKNVYDIEVEDTHNYVGNGVIVHNCFSKKIGTEEHIPQIKAGFIKTMKEKYGVEKAESEKLIANFLRVIKDASDYLFSLNHSDPYSWIGYICGYLRYHYPYEFITTALNIFEDKEEKTLKITEYAKKIGIEIKSIKFRYSLPEYMYDKNTKSIYKGMKSIKYLNKRISHQLYNLRDRKFKDFYDLLNVISTETSVDSRQLEILIQLDFFSEFGNPNQLLRKVELYNEYYKRAQFRKDELTPDEIAGILLCDYTETDKLYKVKSTMELIRFLDDSDNIKTPVKDRIAYENKHLGYIDIVLPDLPASFAYVMDVNGKYKNKIVMLYRLNTGEIERVKIKAKVFDSNPIKVGQIINTTDANQEKRWKRLADGSFKQIDEYETVLYKWCIVK